MKKKDLRNGMVLEERCGDRYEIFDEIKLRSKENDGGLYYCTLYDYNDNLTDKQGCEILDIVKVYDGRGLLLWDRKNQEVTTNEEEILTDLVNAWNKFRKLESQHPDELEDFANGIHKCQYVLAMRFARESRPDLFPKKQ